MRTKKKKNASQTAQKQEKDKKGIHQEQMLSPKEVPFMEPKQAKLTPYHVSEVKLFCKVLKIY